MHHAEGRENKIESKVFGKDKGNRIRLTCVLDSEGGYPPELGGEEILSRIQ